MPKGSVASTASDMLSDLKSRLGFAHDSGDSRSSTADFGEYDDFDDDGFNECYDSEFAGYGSDYDENAPVGGFRPATTRSNRFGRADSTPNLVSIDDVKANTPAPSDGYSARRTGSRNLIDDRAPAQSSPAYNASLRNRESGETPARSEGLNSLFTPYSEATSSASGAARGMAVIRPVTYSDAERIARSLKAGDIVVLAMRSTPENLVQRILDFSFGVASALDANVECPAEKVFAIARGQALTDAEKRDLHSQGVM